jgi:hypothetical protein
VRVEKQQDGYSWTKAEHCTLFVSPDSLSSVDIYGHGVAMLSSIELLTTRLVLLHLSKTRNIALFPL